MREHLGNKRVRWTDVQRRNLASAFTLICVRDSLGLQSHYYGHG